MNRFLLLLFLIAFPPLAGAQINWNGATSGNWGTPANWNGNAVPESGDLLVFPATPFNKIMVNNLPSGTQYESLNFSAPGYTLGGGKMILFVSGTNFPVLQAGHSSGTTTINCAFDQNDSVATFRALTGATLAFGPTATGNLGTGTLGIESFGTVIVNGNLTGNGEIQIRFSGTTRFETAISFNGTTRVAGASTLVLNATLSGPLVITGTLRGNGGTLSSLTMNGDLDPGENGPGRLTVAGSLQFSTTTTTADAFFDLAGTVAGTGYDQITSGGSVTTNGSRVNLRATTAFPVGTIFILINKTSSGAISRVEPFTTPDGTPITEGFEITDSPNRFRYSYAGGNGNDFTATVVPIPPEILHPMLMNVVITPAGPAGSGILATLSGTFTGGRPAGNVLIEASSDLITWRILTTLPLDANGSAVLNTLPDPASEGAEFLYFRGRL